jgi:hypothetical protein
MASDGRTAEESVDDKKANYPSLEEVFNRRSAERQAVSTTKSGGKHNDPL